MAQVADANSTCSERAESEVILSALTRNPNLGKLLQFLAERALEGRAEEIDEYAVATQVFDRSKTTFDGSTDSIAGAVTFRLRKKKLKEYYETGGKDHAVVISLLCRTYVLEFTRSETALHSSAPPPIPQANELRDSSLNTEGFSRPYYRRNQILLYGAVAIILVFLLGLGTFEEGHLAKRQVRVFS